MSRAGKIEYLTQLAEPDIAIVTNVYPMHIEFFENFEGIAEAKAEIFEGLKTGGTAVINEDTNFADVLEKRALEHGARVVKFGRRHHYDGKLELEQDARLSFITHGRRWRWLTRWGLMLIGRVGSERFRRAAGPGQVLSAETAGWRRFYPDRRQLFRAAGSDETGCSVAG